MSQFLNKLDVNSEKRHKKRAHPRLQRQLGTTINKSIPRCAKKWMIKPQAWKSEDKRKEPDNVLIEEEEDEDVVIGVRR